eukprot:scaffold16077_cov35-Tisochrysis_lutea.AAC.1
MMTVEARQEYAAGRTSLDTARSSSSPRSTSPPGNFQFPCTGVVEIHQMSPSLRAMHLSCSLRPRR